MARAKPEWWENFFDAVAMEFWRKAIPEERTRQETDFLEGVLELPAGARVLDVPCGNGRVALELAARDYRVRGVDFSAVAIEEARSRASESGLEVELERREMRDLSWPEEFDGAFCFGGSFGYLDDQGNADFLKAVCRTLKPGCRFILDSGKIAEIVLPRLEADERFEVEGMVLHAVNRYDRSTGRLETEYTFEHVGGIDQRTASERIYTYHEVDRLLEEAGFRHRASYGSVSGEPFEFGSQQLYIVATKSGQ